MEKNQFTLSLALVDALPVLFFGAAAAMLGVKLQSALFIVGAFLAERETVRTLLHAAVRLPSAAFFALTIVGLIAMVVCAKKFDRFDVRANWIEQGINAAAQACALIGVLLL